MAAAATTAGAPGPAVVTGSRASDGTGYLSTVRVITCHPVTPEWRWREPVSIATRAES